jgi:hypothetical protein
LEEIAQISASDAALKDDIEQLFEGVARNIEDADLRHEVETARTYLALLKEKLAASATQRS